MKPLSAAFNIIPYDPESQGAFVRSTWARGALRDPSRKARAVLDAYLGQPGGSAVVATAPDPDKPDGRRLVGWAAKSGGELVFAFVLPVMRRRHLASHMVARLGFPPNVPLPLLYWTPSAQAAAAAGFPVYYSAFHDDDHVQQRTMA